jgi:hypothetical protein
MLEDQSLSYSPKFAAYPLTRLPAYPLTRLLRPYFGEQH